MIRKILTAKKLKGPIFSTITPFNHLFVKSLNKKIKLIYENASPIIISKSESFDLDTEEDLKILKKLFS